MINKSSISYCWQHLEPTFVTVSSLEKGPGASKIPMELSKIASANIKKALSTFLSVLADTSKKVTPYSFAMASPFSYDFFKVTKDWLGWQDGGNAS